MSINFLTKESFTSHFSKTNLKILKSHKPLKINLIKSFNLKFKTHLLLYISLKNIALYVNKIKKFIMTILTKQYIDEHSASLNISRFALTEFTIPDGFTEIGIDAFSQCFALESINIPNSVTTIGEEAFDECTALTCINFPDGMTTII